MVAGARTGKPAPGGALHERGYESCNPILRVREISKGRSMMEGGQAKRSPRVAKF